MKKLLLTIAAVATSAALSVNAQAADSTGCGLGSLAWRGQKGPIPQLFAVTTNGTFGNQTFGISSGTSGCDPQGRITGGTGSMALAFLENNMEKLESLYDEISTTTDSNKREQLYAEIEVLGPPHC